MIINREWLNQEHFQLTHTIHQENNYCIFQQKHNTPSDFNTKSCVYLWLEKLSNNDFDVIYIGKAGSGLKSRFNQHTSGFKNSKTGQKNNLSLLSIINENRNVVVYSRVSILHNFFGHNVSCYSVEEEALIEKCQPWLNRARMNNNYSSSLPQIKNNNNKFKNVENVENFENFENVENVENVENASQEKSYERYQCNLIDDYGLSTLPKHDEILNFYESLTTVEKKIFLDLFNWILSRAEIKELDQRIVGRYTNQPGGFNGMPMLTFSKLGDRGISKPGTWRVRLPLNKLGIVLPMEFLNEKASKTSININENSNSFSPVSIVDFIEDPSKFVTYTN